MRNDNDIKDRRKHRPPASTSRQQSPNGARLNTKSAYERYLTLAKAAAAQGDAIDKENLYQHAEHYLRLSRSQDD